MHMGTLPRCQCHKWLLCWTQDSSEFGAGRCLTLCLSNVTGTATQVNIFPRLLTSSLLPQSRQASKQEMRHWFLYFPMSVVWTLLSWWISKSLHWMYNWEEIRGGVPLHRYADGDAVHVKNSKKTRAARCNKLISDEHLLLLFWKCIICLDFIWFSSSV